MIASLALFVCAVAVMTGGSFGLSWGLERVGRRYLVPSAIMGLVTALGADAPEITTAMTALAHGHHDIGLGVVLGSNLFNLAALVALGAVMAGGLSIRRESLILNGLASLAVTGAAALALYRLLSPRRALAILAGVSAVYVLLDLWRGDRPSSRAGASSEAPGADTSGTRPPALWTWAAVVVALAAIVGGAIYTARTAIQLWSDAGLPRPVLGGLVLAVLSSLPNAFTSAQLARRGRGAAVMGETIGSNTINIVVGVGVPAWIFGLGHVRFASRLELWWLIAMTAATALLALPDGRLGRRRGLLLIGGYLAFVGVRIALMF